MPRRHAVRATGRSSFPASERSLMCNPDCFYPHDGLGPCRVKAIRPRPCDHEGRATARCPRCAYPCLGSVVGRNHSVKGGTV
jgi:hypothetical protein